MVKNNSHSNCQEKNHPGNNASQNADSANSIIL